jgi:hypothetical protein
MYAEYNDSADPKRDWEFSVEFQPEEREEYAFYISVSEGQEQIRQEVTQQAKQTRGRKAHPSLYLGVLPSTRSKTRVYPSR